MPTYAKRLGYGGSAVVDGVQVLITGGSMEQANTPSFLEIMDIPTQTWSRSKVLHADGTTIHTGSVSFDMTENALGVFTGSRLLMRRYPFGMGINDGGSGTDIGWVMSNCYVTTLSMTGSPGGLIGATVGFMSKDVRAPTSMANAYILDDYYGVGPVTNQPAGYWWSGGLDIKEWTFTMNQNVEPVFLNENTVEPRYLKVGLIEYTLDVTLYDEASEGSVIKVMSKTFTLTGAATGKGFTFNGVTELGTYSYGFTTAPLGSDPSGSGGTIISIT